MTVEQDIQTVRGALQWKIDKTTLDDARNALNSILTKYTVLRDEMEWLAGCNPDTNDVNAIARTALEAQQ